MMMIRIMLAYAPAIMEAKIVKVNSLKFTRLTQTINSQTKNKTLGDMRST